MKTLGRSVSRRLGRFYWTRLTPWLDFKHDLMCSTNEMGFKGQFIPEGNNSSGEMEIGSPLWATLGTFVRHFPGRNKPISITYNLFKKLEPQNFVWCILTCMDSCLVSLSAFDIIFLARRDIPPHSAAFPPNGKTFLLKICQVFSIQFDSSLFSHPIKHTIWTRILLGQHFRLQNIFA